MKALGQKTRKTLEIVHGLACDISQEIQAVTDPSAADHQEPVSELLSDIVSNAQGIIDEITDGGDFDGEVDWDE